MRFLNDNQLEAIGYKYIIDNIDTISRLGNDEKYSVKPYTHKKQKELIQAPKTVFPLLIIPPFKGIIVKSLFELLQNC